MPRKLFIAGLIGFILGAVLIFAVPTLIGLVIAIFASAATVLDPLYASSRLGIFWQAMGTFTAVFAVLGMLVTPVFCMAAALLRERFESVPFYFATAAAGLLLYGSAHILFALVLHFGYGVSYIRNIFELTILATVLAAPLIVFISTRAVRRWGERNRKISDTYHSA
jgi:MFS family permease